MLTADCESEKSDEGPGREKPRSMRRSRRKIISATGPHFSGFCRTETKRGFALVIFYNKSLLLTVT